MATAEEGGATAKTSTTTTTATTSSYGGGGGGGGGGRGAGGKFRKKPFRKPMTPYDRPPFAIRGNNGSGSWLTKLVVDPASKLISYGAHRLFASILRRRLPPPPPPQSQELNHVMIDGLPEAVPVNQYAASEPSGGECSQPISSSGMNKISELEQLVKQKTFTRSEIDHLTELLHSRAGEVSPRDDGKRNEETALPFGRHQQLESCSMEANRNEGDGSHGVVSTPISNSKVLGNSIASPAELAKAYMGSRPLKVSPSVLGKHGEVTMEGTRLLSNMRFASKQRTISLKTKTNMGPGSPENGFVTAPRSLGRSAIYNMARSMYWKGGGVNHNGDAGLTMPSTSLSLVENDERSEPKSMSLKRRSYVLDDEIGSVGPIRRIRQKSNLIVPRIPHTGDGVGTGSDAVLVSSKQNFPLICDAKHVQKTVEENADNSAPSTSYAQLPSTPIKVGARVLQHLEKMTPKEKSSESKLVAVRDKSPFKLTLSMLHGRALRSMEDLSSSELLLNVEDDQKFESGSNATLSDAHGSTSQEQGLVEENGPACIPSDTCYTVMNCDSALSLKGSGVRNGTSDSVVETSISQPQNKRAFRMSALEDYVELDDDLECNGFASQPLIEGRGPMEAHLRDSTFSPAEETKLVKKAIQPEGTLPSGLILSKNSELGCAGTASVGVGSNGIATPALEEVTAAAQSAVLPRSVSAFDKPKETNNPPFSSLSSKVPDRFHSLTSESSSRISETKPESSSRLLNISASTGSLMKTPEPEKGGNLKPQVAEDRNGESNIVPSAASNGPLVSRTPPGSFTTASSNNAKQISTDGPVIFTTSTSAPNFVPSITGNIASAVSNGSIFAAAAQPTSLGEPVFGFGASVDPSTTVSATSTTTIPAEGDSETKAIKDPSSGSSLSNVVAFGAASFGNITSGFSSSASNLSANNLQGSLFNSASQSSMSAVGTISQDTSVQLVSFASPPSLNTNGSTSFIASLSGSQVFNPITSFSSNSSASSSDTGAVVPSIGSTSSVFGVNTTAVSDGSAGGSSSVSTPSMFSFGFSSSSTNAVGSTGPAPVFSFGASSPVSASVTTTSSFSSSSSSTNGVGSTGGATTPVFSFGLSSSTSASVTTTRSSFSSSSSSTNAVGSTGGATPPVFGFGVSSQVAASVNNTTSSFGSGSSSVFSFGGSSLASSSAINSVNSDTAPSNAFGSSWPTPKSSIFGSTITSPSPATGFSFGASSTSSVATNAGPVVFSSSVAPSLSPVFSFTTSSASVFPSPSPSLTQPVFGNPTSGFAASPGNNDQMNAEDSMAEDPVQSTAPAPVFGQPSVSPSPSGFMFGSTVPSQANPFQFGGQQNQVAPQNPSMFQASSSLEFNAGGSFSLGSGGGDKSGRKFLKVNRSKNRKK